MHESSGGAMVTVLEALAALPSAARSTYLKRAMPKGIPHAGYGQERFKMQLVVSF